MVSLILENMPIITFGKVKVAVEESDVQLLSDKTQISISKCLQRQLQQQQQQRQVYGGKTSVHGMTSGSASNIAFTPKYCMLLYFPLIMQSIFTDIGDYVPY